jgi:hypothetical protein
MATEERGGSRGSHHCIKGRQNGVVHLGDDDEQQWCLKLQRRGSVGRWSSLREVREGEDGHTELTEGFTGRRSDGDGPSAKRRE